MADISSLLPPPPPKPSFTNRIKIKLEYIDLKAQFYQVSNLKESFLVELAEKESKQLKLRMECDLILDQIELIRSRLPIGHESMIETEDAEMKKYRKYQEKKEGGGFMYESDDQLIDLENDNHLKEGNEEKEEEGIEAEEEQEEDAENEEEEEEEEYDGGEDERGGSKEEYNQHQPTVERHDFVNHPRPLPTDLHQQQQQLLHQQSHLEHEQEVEEEEDDAQDDDEDPYDDAAPHAYSHPHPAPDNPPYSDQNIS